MKLENIYNFGAVFIRATSFTSPQYQFRLPEGITNNRSDDKVYIIKFVSYGYLKYGLSTNDTSRDLQTFYVRDFLNTNSSYFINSNSDSGTYVSSLIEEKPQEFTNVLIYGIAGNLQTLTSQNIARFNEPTKMSIRDLPTGYFTIGCEYVSYRPLSTTSPYSSGYTNIIIEEYRISETIPIHLEYRPKILQTYNQFVCFNEVLANFYINPMIKKKRETSKWLITITNVSVTEIPIAGGAYTALCNMYIIGGLSPNAYTQMDLNSELNYPQGTFTTGTLPSGYVTYKPLPKGMLVMPPYVDSVNNGKAEYSRMDGDNQVLVSDLPTSPLQLHTIELRYSIGNANRNWDWWDYAVINPFNGTIGIKIQEIDV